MEWFWLWLGFLLIFLLLPLGYGWDTEAGDRPTPGITDSDGRPVVTLSRSVHMAIHAWSSGRRPPAGESSPTCCGSYSALP